MRYLGVTLVIGTLVAATVSLAMYLSAFVVPDSAICQFLGLSIGKAGVLHPEQFLVIAICAYGVAWATIDIPRMPLKLVVAAGAMLQIAAAPYVASLYGKFLSPIPGALAIVLAFGAGLAYSRSEAGRRKLQMREVLGRRVSDETFRRLVDQKKSLDLRGELREASIVACRVFNHDELMQELTPKDYVRVINRWLGCTADFLVARGCYLDDCDGEGVRGIFGAIIEEPMHAAMALDAACELNRRLVNLNSEIEVEHHRRLVFRISVNSGPVIAASYGSEALSGLGASGEAVDMAWRLTRFANTYGVTLVAGVTTCMAVENDYVFRPVDMVSGPDGSPMEIYEPLGRTGEVEANRASDAARFWEAVVLTREGHLDDALAILEELDSEHDPLVRFHLARVRMLKLRKDMPQPPMLAAFPDADLPTP